jgi:glutamate-1-semialdehyde 2,1-aminomutase
MLIYGIIRYCDFVGELTAGLYGHSHPRLKEALLSTIKNIGLNLGATTPYEQQYASLICRRFNIDRMRFTNSGTEANLHCIAAAKKFTGRRKVIVFRGGYHGSVLAFSNGIAPNNVDQNDWIVVQYNNVSGVEEAFAKNADIAAVLVEGIQGSGGSISASSEFLQKIRTLTEKVGLVKIPMSFSAN